MFQKGNIEGKAKAAKTKQKKKNRQTLKKPVEDDRERLLEERVSPRKEKTRLRTVMSSL